MLSFIALQANAQVSNGLYRALTDANSARVVALGGGTHFGTVQYSHTFDKVGSFAASVQYYNYGNFQYAEADGYTDGSTFNVSDYAITLGWGRELTDKWSIGANLKYAGVQYETGRAGAIGVDVAATYWSYSNWALTLAARNAGRQIFAQELNVENKWLPFSLDFIASKKLNHLPLTIILGYKDIRNSTICP